MIEHLKLHNIGPLSDLEVPFSNRINILTSDNGLGKTLMMDMTWWALTHTWAYQDRVLQLPPEGATIQARYEGAGSHRSWFDRRDMCWETESTLPSSTGLVVYAQADGKFSIWDPARRVVDPKHSRSDVFSAEAIWKGVESRGRCEGLIRDWATWQREDGEDFARLKAMLHALTDGMLAPGDLQRVSVFDPRAYPTVKLPYSEVPLVHASSGVRKIAALAYVLIWMWHRHRHVCAMHKRALAEEVLVLIDDVEAHLAPQWRRSFLPGLLQVMEVLGRKSTGPRINPFTAHIGLYS